MKVVCPLPIPWNTLYGALREQAEAHCLPPPPVPLILSGWAYSNDAEKHDRWQETIEWATRHGVGWLLERIADHEMYQVEALSTYRVGPLGGPLFLAWSFDPKPRIDTSRRDEAITLLQSRWDDIAGSQLALATRPLRLTGRKGRRLLVRADAAAAPPWGSWSALPAGEARRSFTRLRAAVNDALSPLAIDHIDFEIAGDKVQTERRS